MQLTSQVKEFPELFHALMPATPRVSTADYLAMMCHEIRTPLSAIMGLSGILANPKCGAQKQQECAAMLNDSSKMLLDLLNHLLDSFTLDHQKIELEHRVFDLTQVLNEAKNIIAVTAEEKGLKLLTIGKQVPALFVGDPLRIRQIILNLLGNAVKFTQAGTISMQVTEEVVSGEYSTVNITVADHGIGIEKDKLRTIFGKYVQGSSSTAREHGGSGLGLFISQELAHRMHGHITVKSWPRMGSHFTVTLPLQKATALQQAA